MKKAVWNQTISWNLRIFKSTKIGFVCLDDDDDDDYDDDDDDDNERMPNIDTT